MTDQDVFPRLITAYSRDSDLTRVRRRYELTREIGRGGMGAVFEAKDLNPPDWYVAMYGNRPRVVAVKYLLRSCRDEKRVARFLREADIAHRIEHPNVVRVNCVCVDEHGDIFLVMNYIHGSRTLADVFDHAKRFSMTHTLTGKVRTSVVPLRPFFAIMHQVIDGLEAVHAAGVIHRDMKPENILIAELNDVPRVYLTDFGIAKGMDEESLIGSSLTQEQQAPGTPLYMAPERLAHSKFEMKGRKKIKWGVCKQSDIWSLGVIMYELLTGHLPYFAEFAVMNKDGTFGSEYDLDAIRGMIVDDTIHPPPMSEYVEGLPESLMSLVERCIQKAPWDRPTCVAEVRLLLERAEADMNQGARRAEMPTCPVPMVSSHRSPPELTPVSTPIEVVPRSPLRYLPLLFFPMVIPIYYYLSTHRPESQRVPDRIPEVAADASVVVPEERQVVPSVSASAAPVRRIPPQPLSALSPQSVKLLAAAERYLKQGQYQLANRESHFILASEPTFPPPYRIMAEAAFRRKPQDLNEVRTNAQRYLRFEGTSIQDFSPGLRQALNASSEQ